MIFEWLFKKGCKRMENVWYLLDEQIKVKKPKKLTFREEMKVLRIFLFGKGLPAKREVKELSPKEIQEQQDRERRFAEFDASQPAEIYYGDDMFGNPIMAKKQRYPGSKYASYYSAAVKILEPREREELLCIIKNHRTLNGEYLV